MLIVTVIYITVYLIFGFLLDRLLNIQFFHKLLSLGKITDQSRFLIGLLIIILYSLVSMVW